MWFQATVLFLCAITGLMFFAGWVPNPDVLDDVAPWVLPVWYGLLGVGGVLGLGGSYWRWNPYRGLLAERASMLMVGFGIVLYAFALVAKQGAIKAPQAVLLLVWVLPCIARGVQLGRDMRYLRDLSAAQDRVEALGGNGPVELRATGGGEVAVHTDSGVTLSTPDGVTMTTGEGVALTTTGDVHLTTDGDVRVTPAPLPPIEPAGGGEDR